MEETGKQREDINKVQIGLRSLFQPWLWTIKLRLRVTIWHMMHRGQKRLHTCSNLVILQNDTVKQHSSSYR